MSLWNKPISQITFEDIDAFFQTMQPEGARLDYKGISFPNDLAKSIAAFANTLGGLIILGVEANHTDNKPIWPPQAGMVSAAGLSERVVQIAQEAVYPPVRVAVSQVIENRALPGNVLIVIRINESREAPHAVEKNRHVYVYERTNDRNHPYGLADIGRIEGMLTRRNRLVDQRESTLSENLARAKRTMHESITPIRWISISPVYPWFDVNDPMSCAGLHLIWQPIVWQGVHWKAQTIAKGSFAIGRVQFDKKVAYSVCVSSIGSSGTLFCASYAEESIRDNRTLLDQHNHTVEMPQPMWMNLRNIRDMATQCVEGSCKFYEDKTSTPPGEVMISLGIRNSLGLLMSNSLKGWKSSAEFPDEEFRAVKVVQVEELIQSRAGCIESLLDETEFAFNVWAPQ